MSIDAPQRVRIVSRQEFLREHWRYAPGNHVTFLGPTQRGKTTWCHELLHETISPELKCVILSGKPPGRDPVMKEAAKKLNLRIVTEWPPMRTPGDRKRNGWIIQPHQTMKDLESDERNLRTHFRGAMISCYASQKPIITVVDEAHHVQNDLKLKREYEAPLMRGAPVNGVWSLIQRGRYMSYHAYGAPEHVFIFHDPDRSNRERYSEIGGIDPRLVLNIVSSLETKRTPKGNTVSECLYIRRSGPELMIIDTN